MTAGFLNGFVSERWKIHPFITTLGMLNIACGAALQVSQSRTIFNFPPEFNAFGSLDFFGCMIYAIGNNEEAVRLSGHTPSLYKILAYVLCGATVGLAAIMYMLRLNISSPILGVGFELKAIAVVVIGGTSMSGEKGSMMGTFLGACIIGVLDNGLILIGMGDFARQMVTGLIIVVAVIIDTYRAKISIKTEAVSPH
jgi:ribose transport system permease protein